jgi:hypothetical protein
MLFCFRTYSVSHVYGTNLIRLVVDATCQYDYDQPINVAPLEIKDILYEFSTCFGV